MSDWLHGETVVCAATTRAKSLAVSGERAFAAGLMEPRRSAERPQDLKNQINANKLMSDFIITLDVREDLRQGREPFAKIMQALAELKGDESLLLIAPFEPTPLFGLLAQRGFRHQATPMPGGDWEVLFARGPAPVCADQNAAASRSLPPAERSILQIDARGFEPPRPVIMILEAAEALPAGAELHARTDRKPMHLYDELLRRGFSGQTEELAGEGFLTLIRRK